MDEGILYRRPEVTPEAAYARNQPYVNGNPAAYNTPLPPLQEAMFQAWVQQHKVPFDVGATGPTDYDMRGFYRGLSSGDPKATSAIDPNDSQMHYPDHWKTPYHETFSKESQWATPNAPSWTDDDKLVGTNGRVMFDDRRKTN